MSISRGEAKRRLRKARQSGWEPIRGTDMYIKNYSKNLRGNVFRLQRIVTRTEILCALDLDFLLAYIDVDSRGIFNIGKRGDMYYEKH